MHFRTKSSFHFRFELWRLVWMHSDTDNVFKSTVSSQVVTYFYCCSDELNPFRFMPMPSAFHLQHIRRYIIVEPKALFVFRIFYYLHVPWTMRRKRTAFITSKIKYYYLSKSMWTMFVITGNLLKNENPAESATKDVPISMHRTLFVVHSNWKFWVNKWFMLDRQQFFECWFVFGLNKIELWYTDSDNSCNWPCIHVVELNQCYKKY